MIRRTQRFTFFFRPEAPFSQWHPARFELAGHVFGCAEQYMMYGKAILFGDPEAAAAILEAGSPRQQKALDASSQSSALTQARSSRLFV